MSWFKKKQTGSKIKEAVYVSKLGNKRSKDFEKISVKPQRKGVRKSFVGRYINIIVSDLNIIRSIWKPRVVYIKEADHDTKDLYE
jgi:hypothetical protein